MVKPCAHHHDILFVRIGVCQHLAQLVDVAGIPHRHQNVSLPNSHGAATEFLVAIDAELVQFFHPALALFGYTALGIGEDNEKQKAECNAADRRLALGQQIHNRGGKQYGGNDQDSQRYFTLSDMDIAGDLPQTSCGLFVTEDEHCQRHHGEAPDHSKSVQTRQSENVALGEENREQL